MFARPVAEKKFPDEIAEASSHGARIVVSWQSIVLGTPAAMESYFFHHREHEGHEEIVNRQ
jgi:hypothetical protein